MDLTLQVCLLGLLACLTSALEVGIPERYLRPRDYNPHPGEVATPVSTRRAIEYAPIAEATVLHQVLPEDLPHPYAYFQRPPVHRGESSTAPIQFPKVPDGPAAPAQRLKDEDFSSPPLGPPLRSSRIQKIGSLAYKNYAFSYKVQDQGSGDDFSHQQAHKAGATKGEYRVRLPDGRIQVVSYTADDAGYRADVRYDNENSVDTGYSAPQQLAPVSPISYKPQVTYAKAQSYEDVYPYLQSLEDDYSEGRDALYTKSTPIRYIKSNPYRPYITKDHTPIHEDYPDIPPPDKDHAPRATPQPQPEYLLPSPSPTPAYISPKPSSVLLALASPSSAPHKVIVLPQHIKPYQPTYDDE